VDLVGLVHGRAALSKLAGAASPVTDAAKGPEGQLKPSVAVLGCGEMMGGRMEAAVVEAAVHAGAQAEAERATVALECAAWMENGDSTASRASARPVDLKDLAVPTRP
jgi:hypothetical protein